MTVVLGMSFIVTTFASIFKDIFGFKEGLKNEKEGLPENEEDTEKEETEETEETKETAKKDSDAKKKKKPSEVMKKSEDTKTGDKFGNQKLNPALYNTPSKQNMEKQLGKASEMEQAYDNLEKVMGTENVNSISSDTKDLIKQQNELIKQLKTMTPALNDAMASLGGLDLNKLTGMFNSATKNLSEIKGTE
jgi:peptidoglycan hydrolase CwlO-like protein